MWFPITQGFTNDDFLEARSNPQSIEHADYVGWWGIRHHRHRVTTLFRPIEERQDAGRRLKTGKPRAKQLFLSVGKHRAVGRVSVGEKSLHDVVVGEAHDLGFVVVG